MRATCSKAQRYSKYSLVHFSQKQKTKKKTLSITFDKGATLRTLIKEDFFPVITEQEEKVQESRCVLSPEGVFKYVWDLVILQGGIGLVNFAIGVTSHLEHVLLQLNEVMSPAKIRYVFLESFVNFTNC